MSPRPPGVSNETPQFMFVTEQSQSEARSQAMKEHWKRRHRRNQEAKMSHGKRPSRNLLPRPQGPLGEVSSGFASSASSSTIQQDGMTHVVDDRDDPPTIPTQLLSGLNFALSTSKADPFQTCPIHLTSQHQKLLHHWIITHAVMMFEDLDVTEFNPMKDVWFPLDLSNASSFNCIMAHSAAHMSHLYTGTAPRRGTNSTDALKYKAEAVRILRIWLGDSEKALSDDAFAAVIRLLTFERYWGTVEDWEIHRVGLQRMIDARGGVQALHANWRLELVVYLVSLMSRPSWLEATNNLDRISRPHLSPSAIQSGTSLDIQKVRCLWLISFIQDMRTFMGSLSSEELSSLPFAHAAVGLLRQNFQVSATLSSNDPDNMEWYEAISGCLFAISVLVQESICGLSDRERTVPDRVSLLDKLEASLRDTQHIWAMSVHSLRSVLYKSLAVLSDEGQSKVDYVLDLVQVLGTLSFEARQGVEKCLLNLLYCLGSNYNRKALLVDDGWTPDSLLSSMQGH